MGLLSVRNRKRSRLHPREAQASDTKIGVSYADVEIAPEPEGGRTPIHFTFWWKDSEKWEQEDFHVDVV
jgi:hypothetical protein